MHVRLFKEYIVGSVSSQVLSYYSEINPQMVKLFLSTYLWPNECTPSLKLTCLTLSLYVDL